MNREGLAVDSDALTARATMNRSGKIATVAGAVFLFIPAVFPVMEPKGAEERGAFLGRLKSKHANQVVSSPWGIQIGSLNEKHIEQAGAIGVKWTRLNASWRGIEKERGEYSWEENDRAFASALSNGITPFVCLAGSNRLYCKESIASNSPEGEIYGRSPLPPTKDPVALQGWLNFVRAAIERYKDKIHYWEIWNEPNHWAYWGAQPDGAEYGMLVRETAKVIKAVDPSAKVIAGALAGLDADFTEKFLAGGNAHLIDIITFHNYASLPEERIYKAVDTWRVVNTYNPRLELWQGECGYPSHSSTRDYRGTSPWGVMIQAKWLLRQSFTDLFFCRATLSNYFKLVHEGGRGEMPRRSFMTSIDSMLGFPERNGSRVKSVGVNEKCILENPGLNPKPAYVAYQNLCSAFDHRYRPTTIRTTISVIDPGSFYGVGSEDDAFPSIPLVATFKSESNRFFIAYWLPWHPQEAVREGKIDLVAAHVQFTQPVLINLLDGNVYDVAFSVDEKGQCLLKNIPLADFPFAIAERSEVEILQ